MELDNIKKYAIILIYSDGQIEKVKADGRKFHMEYFFTLNNQSTRLNQIIKQANVYMPDDEITAKLLLTYELDEALARNGVITIHSLFLDEEIREEIEDYSCDYYISMPSELSDKQQEIMNDIIHNYDMKECWYARLIDDKLDDIEYEDMKSMLSSKIK